VRSNGVARRKNYGRVERTAEVDPCPHPGFPPFNVVAGGPGSLGERSAKEGFLATVEEAVALLKERPDDAELYQHLGGLYFQRSDLIEAWQAYMQSPRLNPDGPWTCLKIRWFLVELA
jgi:hypothetical protein